MDQSFIAGVGNIYADEALWRSKLHPLRSAASLRPHDERALYRNVLEILAVAVERRGSSIDDYTAPDGDGEMQEHLDVYQRTGQPCPRCGRPIRRIVIGIRATHFCSFCQRLPAGERPAAAKLLATMTPRPGRAASRRRGRRWVDLDGEGVLGRTPDESGRARERTARTKAAAAARRAAARRGAIATTAEEVGTTRAAQMARPRRRQTPSVAQTPRRRTRGHAPGRRRPAARPRRRARRVSLVRLDGVVREVGTFVILDQVTAAVAPGERIGLVGPNGAGKTTLLRIVAGRDEADRGTVHRRRGLSLGLLSQEAHFDEAFMAAPDLRAAVRHGAAHLERMAVELERLEHGGHAAGGDYADLQHRFDILGGYTLDQRVDEALSGLGFARDEWLRPPTALSGGQQTRAALARLVDRGPGPAHARRAHEPPGHRGDRVAGGAPPATRRARCWSPPTTAPSSTRPWRASGSCGTAG